MATEDNLQFVTWKIIKAAVVQRQSPSGNISSQQPWLCDRTIILWLKMNWNEKLSLLFKRENRLTVVYNNDSVAVTNEGWVTLWICVTGPWGLSCWSGGMTGEHARSVDEKYGPHHDLSIAVTRRDVSPVWGQTLKWLNLKKPILFNVQDSRELNAGRGTSQ